MYREQTGRAIRLHLQFDRSAPQEHQVTLRKLERAEMLVEAPDVIPDELADQPLCGFWVELMNEGREVLYRKVMENPIVCRVEVPDEEDSTAIRMYRSIPDSRQFSLLLPDFEDGVLVVLHSSPLELEVMRRPAEPLWTIELPRTDEEEWEAADGSE